MKNIQYSCLNKATLLQFLRELDKSITYGLDIETTGLNARDSKIALLQIYNPMLDRVFIFKLIDESINEEEQIVLAEIHFVAHNASFERSFMPYLKNLDCSMIAYHATMSIPYPSLERVSNEVGVNYDNKKVMQLSDWSGDLTDEQLEYAAKDARAAYLLWDKYKNSNKPVYDRMYKANFIIDDYSKRGLPVDIYELKKLKDEKENERAKDLQAIREIGYGYIITAKSFTTKKEVLNSLPSEVKKLMGKVRKYNSLINNTITGVEKNIIDGRLPFKAFICGTETGRLTTGSPNVQNFPRDGFKHIFKASENHIFIKADFATQELRMAAALSNEKVMLEAFNNGKDLHALMAARLNRMPMEAFDMLKTEDNNRWKYERQKAKATNFGFLYGMGPERFVITSKEIYGINITLHKAEIIKETFWQTYRNLKRWCDDERNLCNRRRYALTLGGRKRYFKELYKAYCELINTAVQGSCADILLETLLALPEDIAKYLVNTVHDELIFEVPEYLVDDEVKEDAFKKEIEKAMIIGAQKIAPKYPIRDIADIKKVKTLG